MASIKRCKQGGVTAPANGVAMGFRRVGRVYGEFEGYALYEYDCIYGMTQSGGCCHSDCRVASLRAAGLGVVADRLVANAKAKDWLRNWGKLLYDPATDGRHPRKRKAAAEIVRAMRKGTMGYADACSGGAWAEALLS